MILVVDKSSPDYSVTEYETIEEALQDLGDSYSDEVKYGKIKMYAAEEIKLKVEVVVAPEEK